MPLAPRHGARGGQRVESGEDDHGPFPRELAHGRLHAVRVTTVVARDELRVIALALVGPRQLESPGRAAHDRRGLVAQVAGARGQDQADRAPVHAREPALGRGQLAERPLGVTEERRARIGRHEPAGEIGVVPRERDGGEALGHEELDLPSVAGGGSAGAHRAKRIHEDGLRLRHQSGLHLLADRVVILFGGGPQPRVHVGDGLVFAPRFDRRERHLLLKNRARGGVDDLPDQRPEELERRVGVAAQTEVFGARDLGEVVGGTGRQRGELRELELGGLQIAPVELHHRQVGAHQRREPVGRELREERDDPRAEDHPLVGVGGPGFFDGLESRGGLGRRRDARDGATGAPPAPAGERRERDE